MYICVLSIYKHNVMYIYLKSPKAPDLHSHSATFSSSSLGSLGQVP